ncbi:helix-turn-helix domain-containing protein [Quadrisphaera sp. DSM 44207]|uniref:helix-turn-helix domain-containing protein n=1 Tax=Quadrisphaera sp. DSM 44207 TaxID=1881057 RepID=UPI00087E72EB|nr:XRE family transcriptional regulator [Quadrisphaera sp. DSM 44207]SDQ85286.1 transcriptional regulator, XRE family with cupin sensor [Quadrisphaera sp. DSM 44207]
MHRQTSLAADAAEAAVGARLRAARLAQRRSLTDVAAAARLTKGFLSRLERGQTNASVAALVRLCDALDIPPGRLFEAPPVGEVVRAGAYPPFSFGGDGLVEHLLTPRGERRLQAIISQIEPGGGSGEEQYALTSDVEFVFVLAGRLEITFEHEVTQLGPGDAFTYPPGTRHSFRSLEQDGPTRVLWVVSPALRDDGAAELR